MTSRAAQVARGPERAAFEGGVRDWKAALYDWEFWADPRQLPPPGDWRVWLMLAGRGFGKTRTGAEWVHGLARNPAARIALVGATQGDVRAVMIEGESGLLATARGPVKFEATKGRLVWPSGAQAFVHSGECPDGLRGPQFGHAWCDEIAKWAYPEATWDNLAMALRLGEHPRTLVTTTPRPIALLRTLRAMPGTVTVTGRTAENRLLPKSFLAAVHEAYGGTRLGRQELDGELIDEAAGALWTRGLLDQCRTASAPSVRRVVIGVDPPAGIGRDACGIVAVALGRDGCGYVLEDASVVGASPENWARAVAACAVRNGADRVVAEANQGGAMVKSVLQAADAVMPVALVHASRGKVARAEPVAALYEGGKAFHVGGFPALEDELCGLVLGGGYEGPGRSPDRADALVWAMTELLLGKRRGEASVRGL
ncbi:DNA-packaging protein [Sphingomonas japonica]|uniref:Phage terminase large subunit-like protein n=1 Tax=Sphingomonas japonica TaxID=511662 RepID=A0ABX0U1Z0_9SPHN|nr:terminase family protein [Sphingomonas japonica]NIJ23721.1 phage terminase large subunit-like protein [Sphingomonas japonica]